MPRLFVALDLPPERAHTLTALQVDALHARWTPAHQVHLTLRFVGRVDEPTAAALRVRLREVHLPPFSVAGSGLDVLPSLRRARVLVARIDAVPPLMRLQGEIDSIVVEQGARAESRPFFPHVTFARLKHADPREVQRFLTAHAEVTIEAFPVTGFHLYRSDLTPSGATHTVIESYGPGAEP